jgi:hypothetical protein
MSERKTGARKADIHIGLANVLSDPFGKTASGIMRYVLSSSVFDEECCKSQIQKSAKKKIELILEVVRDCRIEPDQRFKMGEAKAHMEYLDQAILRTEAELYVRIQPHYSAVGLLLGLPGVTELSVALIIAETGADMSVFESIWGAKYPLVIQSRRKNWAELSTFFKYPPELRKIIYTTNMIESYHRQLRKVAKGKSVFPTDESLLKMLYLVTQDVMLKWTGRIHNWGQILLQLSVFFPDKVKSHLKWRR